MLFTKTLSRRTDELPTKTRFTYLYRSCIISYLLKYITPDSTNKLPDTNMITHINCYIESNGFFFKNGTNKKHFNDNVTLAWLLVSLLTASICCQGPLYRLWICNVKLFLPSRSRRVIQKINNYMVEYVSHFGTIWPHCSLWFSMWWQIYSISQEICTRFCCALLCCGYAIVHNKFTWSIYPYSSGLLCWHWGNR